jgi:hypothetical protein
MKRFLVPMLFVFGLLLAGGASQTYAQNRDGGKVMVTTTVKNGVVTNWNCGCPKNGETNAFAVNADRLTSKMNEREMQQFMQLLAEFERVNGVKIKSNTRVENHKTTSDEIKSTATGPMEGPGKQLCDFLRRFL